MVLLWRQALTAAVLLKGIGVVLLGELSMVHCREADMEADSEDMVVWRLVVKGGG